MLTDGVDRLKKAEDNLKDAGFAYALGLQKVKTDLQLLPMLGYSPKTKSEEAHKIKSVLDEEVATCARAQAEHDAAKAASVAPIKVEKNPKTDIKPKMLFDGTPIQSTGDVCLPATNLTYSSNSST